MECLLERRKARAPAVDPSRGLERQASVYCGKIRCQCLIDDDELGRDDVYRVQERRACKIRVGERDRRAHPSEPQPNAHIFGAITHEERYRITLLQSLRKPPASVLIGPGCQLAVAQSRLARHQGGRRLPRDRQLPEQHRQGDLRIAFDRGGAFERTEPGLARELRVRRVDFNRGIRHLTKLLYFAEPYHDCDRHSSYTARRLTTVLYRR